VPQWQAEGESLLTKRAGCALHNSCDSFHRITPVVECISQCKLIIDIKIIEAPRISTGFRLNRRLDDAPLSTGATPWRFAAAGTAGVSLRHQPLRHAASWPTIEQALGQSRYLILLASPEAAASHWVNKEIGYWLEAKSADTLPAVTDGALRWDNAANDFAWGESTPLPPALKGRFAAPKWVDLTAYRDGADKGDAKFTGLAADFAAAIRGMPKEDLLSQEVKQQRRALTLASSAAAPLLILAIGATTSRGPGLPRATGSGGAAKPR
jgi:hypothetical protein